MFVRLEIILRTPGPAQGHLHGLLRPFTGGGCFCALVERHNNVAAQSNLDLDGSLRSKEVRSAVEMRAEMDSLFGDADQVFGSGDVKPPLFFLSVRCVLCGGSLLLRPSSIQPEHL